MDDLISRQAAIDAIKGLLDSMLVTDTIGFYEIENVLFEVPSAQQERKTGHWIKTARWGRVYYCDQCRNYLDFDGVNAGRGSTNFCPNCGAKMEE